MIEIFNQGDLLKIKNSDNNHVVIDKTKNTVSIEDFWIDHPGEYEKSWILSEVFEYDNKLFYNIHIEWKLITVLFEDVAELNEKILGFFGDVDVLLTTWNKPMKKMVENIEARVVIPFGEARELLLNDLGQHKEETNVFKLKNEMWTENTEYVNLV